MRDAREVMAELAASGLSAAQNALVMELALEVGRLTANHEAIEKRRLSDKERQSKRRAGHVTSRDACHVTPRDVTGHHGDPPPTQPNSLGSNKNKNPPSPPTGAQTPTTPKPSRGSSLPDDWQPKPRHFAKAEARGQGAEFIQRCAGAMRSWAGANKNRQVARKADWDLAFDGWIDRELDKIEPRPPPSSAQQSFRVVNGNSGANYVNGKRVSPYRGSLAEAARDSLNEALVRSNEGEGIHPDISRRLSFIGRG